MKRVIFVGWVNQGRAPVDGETAKNQYIIAELKKYCKVTVLDFYKKHKHPWVYLQALWALVSQRRATLVLSTSASNIYGMLRWLKKLSSVSILNSQLSILNSNIVHWVIGGTLGDKVKNGVFNADIIGYAKHTLVESPLMLRQLEECGVKGVMQVPNFKRIDYLPHVHTPNGTLRFVFLSRIMPEKGCNEILMAANLLNEWRMQDKYVIDFFGKVADDYRTTFEEGLSKLPNVKYQGFLDMRQTEGYDRLAAYDMMLFPTCWRGEGFAGIFIDAFVSGLPMIITDWAHNSQFVKEGETGLFIPVHDAEALACRMKECIEGRHDIGRMKERCQAEAKKYDVRRIITEKLLKEIEIL
jgi:glycosyltransferase involved in cell wall biosynthesis